jgi:hypothetical protein
MITDTGFDRHIDVLVDAEGENPPRSAIKYCRSLLGPHTKVKWLNVAGFGYEKDWMWVMGVNYTSKNLQRAPASGPAALPTDAPAR